MYSPFCSLAPLDSSLPLGKQKTKVARSAFYQVGLLCQLQPFLNKTDLSTWGSSGITAHLQNLDYKDQLRWRKRMF